jgi:pimeloyl-ACP methyl ester carboxylesterase
MPLIDSQYRTQPYRILAGWSFGGLFTVHTYLENPEAFSAYLAISPSLWWEQDSPVKRTEEAAASGSLSPKPLIVTLGALEGGDMGRSVRRGFFPIFESDRLSGLPFTPVEIPEGTHYYSPYQAFFAGLPALFEDWSLPQERLKGGLESVQDFYRELSARVGYTVIPPEPAYQALIGSLISDGDDEAALEIARILVDKYPQSSRAHKTLGVMFRRTGDDAAARARFELGIEVEKDQKEPDSERIMDVWLNLWLLDPTIEWPGSDRD